MLLAGNRFNDVGQAALDGVEADNPCDHLLSLMPTNATRSPLVDDDDRADWRQFSLVPPHQITNVGAVVGALNCVGVGGIGDG